MKIRTYLIIWTLLQFGFVSAQISQTKIDSLKQAIQKQTGVEQLHSLDYLIDKYYRFQTPDSFVYYNKILFQKAQKYDNNKYIASYYANLSYANMQDDKYYKAIEQIDKAISITQQFHYQNGLADYYKTKAGIFYHQGKYNEATQYLFKAINLYETLQNNKGLIASYQNIALLFKESGDRKSALKYLHKALDLINNKYPKKSKSYIYNTLGMLYKRKNPDSALYFYRKSLSENKKYRANQYKASDYYNIANVYAFYKKNKDSANYYYNMAEDLSQKYNPPLLKNIFSAKARMYYQQKDYPRSIALNQELYKKTLQNKDWETRELVTYYLYNSYRKIKKWDSAMYFLEDFVDTHDTIINRNTQITLANLESKYENKKNKAKLELYEQKQNTDRIIKWTLTIGFVGLALLFALMYNNYRQKKKRIQAEKEKAEQEVLYKTKQLTSQALMMLQKNKLLDEILKNLSEIKEIGLDNKKQLQILKRKLKKTIHSEEDWELFKHYFEDINKDFFEKLKAINPKITPSEMKLAALIKLRFNIKETAELLNQSPESVKTARYQLRKKLNLQRSDNLYAYLNSV